MICVAGTELKLEGPIDWVSGRAQNACRTGTAHHLDLLDDNAAAIVPDGENDAVAYPVSSRSIST